MKKQVLENLNKGREKLDEIAYLNWGGCAISAIAIYIMLRKLLPRKEKKKVKVVFIHWNSNVKNKSLEIINNSNKIQSLDGCVHAIIKYEDNKGKPLYLDSEYITRNRSEITKADEIVEFDQKNIKFAIATAANPYIWDSVFDRDYGVPKIAAVCGKNFPITN